MNAYQKLYEVWDKKKNTAKTLEYFRLYSEVKDSLFIDEQYRAITEMDIKYQSEKKEQDIALLTEQNKVQELMISRRSRMMLAIAIVFLLSIIIGYYLLINTRLKARHKAVELENRLLRSQMNPHFIFNSLIAIQSFIYQKDPITAGDYLSKFAELVRTTLENSRVEFVMLEKELKMLEIYLQLQQLRFESKFTFTIEKDESIDIEAIKIPPMLSQPFIENSIEHGLRLKENNGNIIISFRQIENDIEFIVEDDGVGREFAAQHKKAKHSQSMATLITRERLEVMGKKFKRKFTLSVIDLKDEDEKAVGTRVVITMPYLENV
jgi:LytS/YehU family sensor histidine kinase